MLLIANFDIVCNTDRACQFLKGKIFTKYPERMCLISELKRVSRKSHSYTKTIRQKTNFDTKIIQLVTTIYKLSICQIFIHFPKSPRVRSHPCRRHMKLSIMHQIMNNENSCIKVLNVINSKHRNDPHDSIRLNYITQNNKACAIAQKPTKINYFNKIHNVNLLPFDSLPLAVFK